MISEFENFRFDSPPLGSGGVHLEPGEDLWSDFLLGGSPPAREDQGGLIIKDNKVSVEAGGVSANLTDQLSKVGGSVKSLVDELTKGGAGDEVKDTVEDALNSAPKTRPEESTPPEYTTAQAMKGDSMTKICRRAYAEAGWEEWPSSKRIAVMRAVARHELNAKIEKTSKFGYEALIGMKGPLLTPDYSGLNTAKGSGRSYPILAMPAAPAGE